MKKMIFLSLVLLIAGFTQVSAQSKTKPTQKPAVSTVGREKTPLTPYYGKKMLVRSHKKQGAVVNHPAGDSMVFKADGTLVQSWNGTARTGTWTYNQTANTITISMTGGNSMTFTIATASATELKLTRTGEELVLYPGV